MNEKKEKMQVFRKKKNTGMHKTTLSAGSKVNGEVLKKRRAIVLRPGNTVLCAANDLGQMGIKQFDLLSPPLKTAAVAAGKAGIPVLKKREKGGWYDVVNPNDPDTPLNQVALTKAVAKEFLADLLDDDVPEDEEVDVTDLEGLDWDALVKVYEEEGGVLDEEEEEDDLKEAIAKLRKEK